MTKKIAIIISPNWKDYAKKYLSDCIKGLREQDYEGRMRIFMSDNESTEESVTFIKSMAPEIILHRNENNDGFAKGCNDVMKIALHEGFDYIILFNIDSIIEKSCVRKMVEAAENDPKIGALQARMMLWPEKELINSLGNETHFLGFGYCRGYRDKLQPKDMEIKDIFYPSGTAVLYRREALEAVGLFDEEYWMYNEDQELPWRMWLNGWRSVIAPQAVVYNKYDFSRSIKKFYWMDRNRIISIIKCYHILTLLLIAPAWVIMEFGLLLFSLKTGWFKTKLSVYAYFLKPKSWRYLYRARREAQKLRTVKDREIARLITGEIKFQEINDWKLNLINPVFRIYWKVAKRLIFW